MIDILVDGQPIHHSPIRVMVVAADCESEYGVGSHRIPDSEGRSVCEGHTYTMGDQCVEAAYFFIIVSVTLFIGVGALLFLYLRYKRAQSDSVWQINVEELLFSEPPEVIGQGGFGIVILGQYRGTNVAVKRVLPPSTLSRYPAGTDNSSSSGEQRVSDENILPKSHFRRKPRLGTKSVKFDDNSSSGDVESQKNSMSGNDIGSTQDWERVLMKTHSNNDILQLLESATTSDQGFGYVANSHVSKGGVMLKILSRCLRFDKHSRHVSEFVNEMRMLSRLRHPFITTVMGAVVSTAFDPMLGKFYFAESNPDVLCFTNGCLLYSQFCSNGVHGIWIAVRPAAQRDNDSWW